MATDSLLSAVSCNLDPNLLQAILPLFEQAEVEAIEWSFDALHGMEAVPDWFTGLLGEFSQAGRLMGHGIYYSLFSGKWLEGQEKWLRELAALSKEYRFAHVTEHFGFMTGPDFHKGAPLAVPLTEESLALGRDRLQRLALACRCPVGLENLAFAWSREEAELHGHFLEKLLEPVNGFLILDLHNVYCQLMNFGLRAQEALLSYPLDRVREIHISGGSWADSRADASRRIRRDTHDDRVPEQVFSLLESAIPLCPNLRYVVLEQMGIALETEAKREQFREDFREMSQIARASSATGRPAPNNDFQPMFPPIPEIPAHFPELHRQQMELSRILEKAAGPAEALAELTGSPQSFEGWKFDQWPPYMLETALDIAQKWKDGFN